METPEDKLRRVLSEEVALVPYDPRWPEAFRAERDHLRSCLPPELVGRIEHAGSTAVPGLVAKPIVDMLIEVADLQATRARIAPVLEAQGYDYFWRPTHGDNGPPFYAWFIKRAPGPARGPTTCTWSRPGSPSTGGGCVSGTTSSPTRKPPRPTPSSSAGSRRSIPATA